MLAEQPPMEAMVVRYEQMRQDIVDRLDRELGAKGWGQSPNETVNMTSLCAGPASRAERFSLSLFRFTGTYGPADQQRVLDIVTDVAAGYEFSTRTVRDRPQDVEISGTDSYDAVYTFRMENNTTFRITSGCHLPVELHPSP